MRWKSSAVVEASSGRGTRSCSPSSARLGVERDRRCRRSSCPCRRVGASIGSIVIAGGAQGRWSWAWAALVEQSRFVVAPTCAAAVVAVRDLEDDEEDDERDRAAARCCGRCGSASCASPPPASPRRRASRFWRWRSRLVALGTAGESTDAECRMRGSGEPPRYHGRVVSLLVQKFGGTSVADPDRIRAVAEHIVRTRRAGQRRRGRRLGHGQDHRRPRAPRPRRVERPDAPARWTCCSRRVSGSRSRCSAWRSSTGASRRCRFTGSQAGIVTDTAHRKAKILEIRGDRLREALDAGNVASSPGSRASPPSAPSPRSAAAAPTPPPSRWRPRSSADVCEIYTDVAGCLHRRPPHRARRPPARPPVLRRDARDGGDRRPRARAAVGRVRPQLRRARPRAVELHVGDRHLGARRGASAWKQPIISGVTHDTRRPRSRSSTCPTVPASRPSCSARSPTRTSTST